MEFKQAVKYVIDDEGGYVNHPKDPGGETKYGISKRSYPGLDIKNLTVQDAERIYKDDFWDDAGTDRIPEHLRYQYFDMTVNHGAGNAIKILQAASEVPVDGKLGPTTIGRSAAISNQDLAEARAKFFARIVKSKPSQSAFIEGWIHRVFKVLKRTIK